MVVSEGSGEERVWVGFGRELGEEILHFAPLTQKQDF